MSIAASSAVGPPPGMKVRLSSNESAWGPSPAAIEAASRAVREGHRYPDDQAVALRTAIADHEGRSLDEVAVGNGSAAILMDLIAQTCVPTGGAVLSFERGFIVYRLGARNAGVPYVEAPTDGPASDPTGGYARGPDALLERIDADTALVVIDNPGNPTGVHLTGDQLAALVAGVPEHVTVVVDEAYHQFAIGRAGYATTAELGLDHPRLVTLRTFSKAYGMAGFRVGYALGAADVIGPLDAWRARFNVTRPSQDAAVAALGDTDHLERTITGVVTGRDRMQAWLTENEVPFTPSLGNFVTIELDRPSPEVVEAFAAFGVGVRPLAPYGMDRQIRVTVGTAEEVDAFLEAAGEVLTR